MVRPMIEPKNKKVKMDTLMQLCNERNKHVIDFVSFIQTTKPKEEQLIVETLTTEELYNIYSTEVDRLCEALMWHRNKPVSPEYLQLLYDNINLLPRRLQIILESFPVSEFPAEKTVKREAAMLWWNKLNLEEKFYKTIKFNHLIDGDKTRNPDTLTGREIEILYKQFFN